MAETTTTPPADPSVAATKAAVTRKTNAVKRSTTAKKAAQTRAANQGAAARSTATSKAKADATRARTAAAKDAAEAKSAMKTRMEQAVDVAEKAVLVPFGAVLVTRDRVKEAIDELRSTYSTRKKTEAELKRFQRRGSSALKPLVRDAKKTRERVEKELRYGRTRIEKDVRMVVKDFEPVSKNVELVTARVENAVQGAKTGATKASTSVQERIAALV
jgi:DNA repair exonuclease SbcCD ATPase subunit